MLDFIGGIWIEGAKVDRARVHWRTGILVIGDGGIEGQGMGSDRILIRGDSRICVYGIKGRRRVGMGRKHLNIGLLGGG